MILPDATAFFEFFVCLRGSDSDCINGPCMLFAPARIRFRLHQRALHAFCACEDQIPIATPDLVCFHVSDDQIPIESPDLVCFYVSENQIPIATPDYASFSRPQ